MTDWTPPANIDAEAAVLGALILQGDLWPEVADLTADDFYRARHECLFGAMQAIVAAGRSVDIVTLTDHLIANQILERAGGHAYLAELMDGKAGTVNLQHYVDIVAEKALRRRAVGLLQRSIGTMIDESSDAPSALIAMQGELGRLAAGGRSTSLTSAQLAANALERFEQAFKHRAEHGEQYTPGLKSGIAGLDTVIGGFQPGYHVIAGETSMGKSAFALGRSLHFAIEEKAPGLYISLEDFEPTMAARILAARTQPWGGRWNERLTMQDIRFGVMPQVTGWQYLTAAVAQLSGAPIYWNFETRTIGQMVREIRQHKAKFGIRWVVVDYIQRVHHKVGRGENRAIEVSQISNALADAAHHFELSLLALSQLKRIEHRSPHRPYLTDLKDSGTIEQDAHTVIFVNRPGKIKESEEWPENKTELIIDKNKQGPLADILLDFHAESMSFYPWPDTVTR
jgi:replicative DNA helicase